MEPNGQETSFIPKEGVGRNKIRMKAERSVNGMSIGIGMFAFLAVAVFLTLSIYQGVLLKENKGLQEDIADVQSVFNKDLLAEVQVVDRKLQATGDILAKHMGFGAFLRALEEYTIQNVQYEGVVFSVESKEDEVEIRATLSGEASNFMLLAEQAALYKEVPLFQGATFSGFSLTDIGTIGFETIITLKPEELNFSNNFEDYAR